MASVAPVVIAATAKQTATLIFLHGLGDTGHGWASAISEIRQPYMKVICPTAQPMPVSLNNGFVMPSWFDLKSLDVTGPEDEAGIKKATENIHAMIEAEVKNGTPAERIILGGFSQGAALALYSGLTYSKKLAGIMSLSGWLPLHKSFPAALKDVNKEVQILQCHGDSDPIVPYKWGQLSASILKTFAKNTEFRSYRGLMHTSSEEELRDLKEFAKKVLPNI